jgi:hypothetical protein
VPKTSTDYLELLCVALVFSISGALVVLRAGKLASWVARQTHDAPFLVASLFLVRPRFAEEADTARYLRVIFALFGVALATIGILLLVVVAYNLKRA